MTCRLLRIAAVAAVSDQTLTEGREMMAARVCMASVTMLVDEGRLPLAVMCLRQLDQHWMESRGLETLLEISRPMGRLMCNLIGDSYSRAMNNLDADSFYKL